MPQASLGCIVSSDSHTRWMSDRIQTCITPSGPEQFGALISDEIERLGKIAKAANMRVD